MLKRLEHTSQALKRAALFHFADNAQTPLVKTRRHVFWVLVIQEFQRES